MGKRVEAVGKAGRAIRRWCDANRVSQAELARRAGVSRGYLTVVIRGFQPSLSFCERIERATGGDLVAADLVAANRAA
jgi:transcriptional regulator with XRE-family HTH domain